MTETISTPRLETSDPGANAPLADGEMHARIKELQAMITRAQQEIIAIRDQYRNHDPKLVEQLKTENRLLQSRVSRLEGCLFALIQDDSKPRNPGNDKLRYEIFKSAIIEFCQAKNVDPGIWKSLES